MRRSIISNIAVLLLGLWLTACAISAQGPIIWLDRPLDGDQVVLEPLTIQVHASDADGVARFEFFVDDQVLGTVAADGGRLSEGKAGWSPAAPGTYTVRARAVDLQGNLGSEARSVIAVSGIVPSTSTPAPAPFPIAPTPTPVPLPVTPTLLPTQAQIAFSADRTSLTVGECATLRWSVQGDFRVAEVVHLNGREVNRSGSQQVCPQQTTTYTLAAIGSARTERQVVISVVYAAVPTASPPPPIQPPPPPQPPACPGAPVIASFTSNPTTINAGQSSTLSWGLVSNATSAMIEPGIGGIATPGSTAVSPATTTTYTLIASGCGGTTRRQVTILVNPVASPLPQDTTPPSISNLTVNPTMVVKQGPGCPNSSRTTTIRATVTDVGGVNRVVARILGTGIEVTMNPVGGNAYQTTLGPFDATGTLSVLVQAWDNAGNGAQAGPLSIQVVACIG